MSEESSVDIAKKSWARMNYSQRKTMVTNLGYNPSFAKAKTMEELVERGGGMVARDVHKTAKLWKAKNPRTDILW